MTLSYCPIAQVGCGNSAGETVRPADGDRTGPRRQPGRVAGEWGRVFLCSTEAATPLDVEPRFRSDPTGLDLEVVQWGLIEAVMLADGVPLKPPASLHPLPVAGLSVMTDSYAIADSYRRPAGIHVAGVENDEAGAGPDTASAQEPQTDVDRLHDAAADADRKLGRHIIKQLQTNLHQPAAADRPGSGPAALFRRPARGPRRRRKPGRDIDCASGETAPDRLLRMG
jgi:hypothetical protein